MKIITIAYGTPKGVTERDYLPLCTLEAVNGKVVLTPTPGRDPEQCEDELGFKFTLENGRRITVEDGDECLKEMLNVGNGYYYHDLVTP